MLDNYCCYFSNRRRLPCIDFNGYLPVMVGISHSFASVYTVYGYSDSLINPIWRYRYVIGSTKRTPPPYTTKVSNAQPNRMPKERRVIFEEQHLKLSNKQFMHFFLHILRLFYESVLCKPFIFRIVD